MATPERCLRCDWWNHRRAACDRVFKAKVRIAHDGGEVYIETQPGLLPENMDKEFSIWLMGAIEDMIDSWPGWNEIKRIRDGGKECPSEKPSASIKEFGVRLSLAKPLKGGLVEQEPDPLQNKDRFGLFKSDVSLL